jgi:hypothetical protein
MSKAAELANLIGNINAGGGGVNRNLVINGAMNVAQRGTSVANTGYQTVDRFQIGASGTDETPTQAQVDIASGATPYTLGFRKAFRVTNGNQTSGAGTSDIIDIKHVFEAQNVATSGWNFTSSSSVLSLSFWVKSSVAQNFFGHIKTFDGTVYNYPFSTGSLTADTWTKVTKTIPGNSNLTINNDNGQGLEIRFLLFAGTGYTASVSEDAWVAYDNTQRSPDNTSTWYTTNDATFEITGVQLEIGQNPTSFEHEPYERTLAKCKRYFEHCFDHGTFPVEGNNYGLGMTLYNGVTWLADNIRAQIHFLVRKRADPTMTAFNVTGLGSGTTANRWRWWSGSAWEETSGATDLSELNNTGCFVNVVESDASANNPYMIGGGWSADAEL